MIRPLMTLESNEYTLVDYPVERPPCQTGRFAVDSDMHIRKNWLPLAWRSVQTAEVDLRYNSQFLTTVLVGAALNAFISLTAGGQVIEPLRRATDPLSARADSALAIGDSTGAIALLDSALRKQPNTAHWWYQFGMLQWRLASARQQPAMKRDGRVGGYLRGADSALRLATQLASDSAQYWVSLGQFNLRSDYSTVRASASRTMKSAFEAASRVHDTLLIALSADEVGMGYWRSYEAVANRAMTTDGSHIQLTNGNNRWRRDRGADYISSFAKPIEPPTGEADYSSALQFFERAVTANPISVRFSRHLYMGLAVAKRWEELLRLGLARAERYPFDPYSRFASGLAHHRLGHSALAQAAFDSAITLLDDGERDRMMRITRIMRPRTSKGAPAGFSDSVGYAQLPDVQQRVVERAYWLLNDPLMITPENEYQLEFISRVAESEIRWSDESAGLHGADSDRGDIFVRYGPPDLAMTIAGASSVQQSQDDAGVMRMSTNENGGVTLVWSYLVGQTFFFDLAPAFGSARLPLVDQQFVGNVKLATPTSWANLGIEANTDTLDVRVTRFRAASDSTDVVIVARLSPDSLLRDGASAISDVRMQFRTYDGFARLISLHTDTLHQVRPGPTVASVQRNVSQRIGRGTNLVRVEAVPFDSRRFARATLRVDAEVSTGFGVSDILFISAEEPPVVRAGVSGWRALNAELSNGVYRTGSKIGFAWETYELRSKDESNHYRIAISVTREKRAGVTGVAFRVLDRVGTVLTQGKSGSDQVTISFDRTSKTNNRQLEYFSMDGLGDSPGTYQLRIEITDLVTGEKRATQSFFRLKETSR